MATLPSRIVIGPYTFPVSCDEETDKQLDEDGCAGQYRIVPDFAINIHTIQGENRRRTVLMHEVLHGVADVAGLAEVFRESRKGQVTEEIVVNSLATILTDTLRRNPDLVAYLMDTDGD